MKIYAKDDGARRPGSVFMTHIAPGSDPESADGPVEWFNEDGSAITFPVTFRDGAAEVPDPLGRFMVAKGYAKRTSLLMPFVGVL